ncbi:MAG: hypothetical protein AAF902_07525 [Chloroflexota bacterium]
MNIRNFFAASLLIIILAIGAACSPQNAPPIVAVTPIAPPTLPAEIVEFVEQVEQPVEQSVVAEGDGLPSTIGISGYPPPAVADDGYPAPIPVAADVASDGYPAQEETYVADIQQVDIENMDPAPIPTPPHTVPTPVIEELPAGQALTIAYAQDLGMTYELAVPVDFGDDPIVLNYDEFFDDYDPWSTEPPVMSARLKSLDGQRVVMEGYMAPPLKLGLDWFMLTAVPVGACPFCSGASQWTPDIVLIYVEGQGEEGLEDLYTYYPLKVEGELHIGEVVDTETGMVSLVRIYTNKDNLEEITFSN